MIQYISKYPFPSGLGLKFKHKKNNNKGIDYDIYTKREFEASGNYSGGHHYYFSHNE
jgi:hypothetical protein